MAEFTWMLYGVTGKTGRMILDLALERGHRPVVAGRNAAAVREIAELHALPWEAFDLHDEGAIDHYLTTCDVLANIAGPYTATALPLVRAAIRTGTGYLDVCGELQVLQAVAALDEAAEEAGVFLLPGCGFEIIPSDAIAEYLYERMPEGVELELAIASESRISVGTFRAATGVIAQGGFVRRNGSLRSESIGVAGPNIRFHQGERKTIRAPLPDLLTAWRRTGIGTITTYLALPPGAGFTRRLGPMLQSSLRIRPIRRMVNAAVSLAPQSREPHRKGSGSFWGRIRGADGRTEEAWLATGEPYSFTACGVIMALERLRGMQLSGFHSPVSAFGVEFAEQVSGNSITSRLPI